MERERAQQKHRAPSCFSNLCCGGTALTVELSIFHWGKRMSSVIDFWLIGTNHVTRWFGDVVQTCSRRPGDGKKTSESFSCCLITAS